MTHNSSHWPIPHCTPDKVGLARDGIHRAQRLVQDYIDQGKVAGALWCVLRKNQCVAFKCQGWASIEEQKPIEIDTLFRWYSMTKLVTSAVFMTFIEEGRIYLTDPVSTIIPECKKLVVQESKNQLTTPIRELTFHHLLSHTGGLSYDGYWEAKPKGLTLESWMKKLLSQPLLAHPGERWIYSASADLLGYVMEKLEGKPLSEIYHERLFQPLGMTETGFYIPEEKVSRLASMYEPSDKGLKLRDQYADLEFYFTPPKLLSGGGGLAGPAYDYIQFALMMLNGGTWNNHKILSRKSIDLMCRNHLPPGHPPIESAGRHFGLGFAVMSNPSEARELSSLGEYGWSGAACTQIWIDPKEEMITMIMPQYRSEKTLDLMRRFKNCIYSSLI